MPDAADGGIEPMDVSDGGGSSGGGPGSDGAVSTSANKKEEVKGGADMLIKPMKRPGWLGNVPGAYNGGMNDTSNALRIIGEISDLDQGNGLGCEYGTGFDENGEPILGTPNAYKDGGMSAEFGPSWAYSTCNWEQPKHGRGDPNAGKGPM